MKMRKVVFVIGVLALGIYWPKTPVRGSLILGNEARRNLRLYEQIVAERSENPIRFDRLHPILGELLTDRASFEYWLNRWQAHPARFERYHPWFWRVIDGESLASGPPVTPHPVPPLIPPAGESGNPPIGPGPLPPEPPNPPEPPPPPPPPVAPLPVPEPGSLTLILGAAGLVLIARGGYGFLRSR